MDTIHISMATEADRETIYRIRHAVYGVELGQHPSNAAQRLTDACDTHNLYLVAYVGHHMAGFVSITPPGGFYSIDKYLQREDLPFPVTETVYEVRLLTVCREDRGGRLAGLLMYAAFRQIEAWGGTRIMAIGRQALKPLYQKSGLCFTGVCLRSGAVDYELMSASLDALRARLQTPRPLLRRLRKDVDWDLPFPFAVPTPCVHGGASFDAIGDSFQTLSRRHDIIAADVLDAWFPPSPAVLKVLREHLPWLLQTSPPKDGMGLIQAIATARGVPAENLAIGAGSSALIYLALRHWLSPQSRVLLPDPTYGEYAHVLEQGIGCHVDRLALSAADDYRLDLNRLRHRIKRAGHYDAVVLVNPNNPTGQFLPRTDLEAFLAETSPQTRVWVDEAYIDYLGPDNSVEGFAARSPNAVVCKSLSKCYALSGARAAYLCGPAAWMQELRFLTPPWSVSLPAQIAAAVALQEPAYYQERYAETAVLRDALAADLCLSVPGLTVHVGPANWLLCRLPSFGPDAAMVGARCREKNVFLRETITTSPRMGTHTLRVAVKDAASNRRIVNTLIAALAEASGYGFDGVVAV